MRTSPKGAGRAGALRGLAAALAATFLPLLLAATFPTPSQAAEPVRLKLATATAPAHAYNVVGAEFARRVKEYTAGAVEVRVFPGGQLGNGEREILEGLQMGSIDLAVSSTAPISGFSPQMMVLDLPFLIRDEAHADAVLDGPVGERLLSGLAAVKLKGLAYFENGFRQFTNSVRPLEKPADFKGLKFRTQENPIHLAAVRALGAQAVPMGWGEVYTALQTHVIDGQENPIAIVVTSKLYEVQKYLTLSGHLYSAAPFLMSLARYEALSPAHRAAIERAARECAVLERRLIRDPEKSQIEDLKARGMDVRAIEKAPFVAAMEPVYAAVFREHPDWESVVAGIRALK